MTTRRPAEVFHPGTFIAEELAERGWSAESFVGIVARRSRVPKEEIRKAIAGEASINEPMARGLAFAFGTSEVFWLNLQRLYDAGKGRKR